MLDKIVPFSLRGAYIQVVLLMGVFMVMSFGQSPTPSPTPTVTLPLTRNSCKSTTTGLVLACHWDDGKGCSANASGFVTPDHSCVAPDPADPLQRWALVSSLTS